MATYSDQDLDAALKILFSIVRDELISEQGISGEDLDFTFYGTGARSTPEGSAFLDSIVNRVKQYLRAWDADTLDNLVSHHGLPIQGPPGDLLTEATTNEGKLRHLKRAWNTHASTYLSKGEVVPQPTASETSLEELFPEPWNLDDDAPLYIGPYPVHLPGPDSISIQEDYGVSGAGSLRTDGDPVWREPRARVRIDVEAIFANAAEVNEKLRPILALLRACPLTILKNDYINRTVIRHVDREGIFDAVSKAVEIWKKEGRTAQSDIYVSDAFTILGLPIEDNDLDAFYETIKQETDTVALVQEIAKQKHSLQVLSTSTDNLPPRPENIPVMIQAVRLSSIPETSGGAIRATFSFSYVDDATTTKNGLRFLDNDGNETTDIRRCGWLRRYVELSYLTDDLAIGKMTSFDSGLEILYDPDDTIYTVKPIKADNEDMIVEGVQCGYETKLAHIPVLGREIPSAQYVGRKNAVASLVLNCSLDGLEKITYLKTAIEHNMRSSLRRDRADTATVLNPILQLLGIKRYIIRNIVTHTHEQAVNRYRVVLTLIEAEITMQNRELLSLRGDTIQKDLAKSFWDYLHRQWRKVSEDPSLLTSDPEVKAAFHLLLGTRRPLYGTIYTQDLLKAVVLSAPNVSRINWEQDGSARMEFDYHEHSQQRDDIPPDVRRRNLDMFQHSRRGSTSARTAANSQPNQPVWTGSLLYADMVDNTSALLVRHVLKNLTWNRRGRYEEGNAQRVWDVLFKTPLNKEQADRAFEYMWYRKRFRPPSDWPDRYDEELYTWNRRGLEDAYKTLYTGLTALADKWVSWKDKDKLSQGSEENFFATYTAKPGESLEDLKRSLSNYPDFKLPTYRTLFSIKPGKLNPVWVRFAPTWASLGKAPPFSIENFAANPDDRMAGTAASPDNLIEPTFYYSAGAYKTEVLASQEEMLAQTLIGKSIRASVIEIPWTTEDLEYFKGMEKEAAESIASKIQEIVDNETLSEDSKASDRAIMARFKQAGKSANLKVYVQASENGAPIAILVPVEDAREGQRAWKVEVIDGRPRAIYDFYNRHKYTELDTDNVLQTLRAGLDGLMEDKQDVKRCFPAFRVRLIDFDTGLYSDNVYDYNAIKSIHVTKDKYDAALCEIEFMNVTGILDDDRFITKIERVDLGLPKLDAKARSQRGEMGERESNEIGYLKGFLVKEGTAIQVLMGYSVSPLNMENVFTGRISQFQPGDVLRIVAQDYKTELQNEVTFHLETPWLNRGVPGKKNIQPNQIVYEMFRQLDGEGGVDPEDWEDIEDRKNGTPHLGDRLDLYSKEQVERERENLEDIFGSVDTLKHPANQYYDDASIPSIHGRSMQDLFGMRPSRMINLTFRTIGEGTGHDDWVCEYQPAFDHLLELTRYQPGWVCDVLPYDHLATLYIGPPEGDYRHTNSHNRALVQSYRKYQTTLGAPPQDVESLTKTLKVFYTIWRGRVLKRMMENVSEKTRKLRERRFAESPHEYHSCVGRHINLSSIKGTSEHAGANLIRLKREIQRLAPDLYEVMTGIFWGFDLVKTGQLPNGIEGDFWTVMDIILRGDVRERAGSSSEEDLLDTIRSDLEIIMESSGGFRVPLEDISTILNARITSGGFFKAMQQSAKGAVEEDWFHITRRLMLGGSTDTRDLPWEAQAYLSSLIVNFAHIYRAYIVILWEMVTSSERDPEVLKSIAREVVDTRWQFQEPDRKPFRQVHHVTSSYDIIANNIVASTTEMANTVLVRYPSNLKNAIESDEGGEFGDQKSIYVDEAEMDYIDFGGRNGIPYHDDIKLEEKKLVIAVEKNAENRGLATAAFFSRMGEALRPMYRGNLVIWGRAIKPHDWVFITDNYNDMRGPIEVERVTHHFTPTGGWTTTIIPHAVVHVDNAASVFAISFWHKFFRVLDVVLDVADVGLIAFALLSLGTGLTLKAGWTGLRTVLSGAAKKSLGKTMRSGLARRWSSRAAAKQLIAEGGAAEALKMTGAELTAVPWVKTLVRDALLYGGVQAADFGVNEVGLPLTTMTDFDISGNGDKKSLVSITPLMYKGRPMVAGLSLEDRHYRLQIENGWDYFTNAIERAIENLIDLAGEEEIPLPPSVEAQVGEE